MREKLPWQKFYRAAQGAGYELELPGTKDRADFRAKLKQYTGLDPRRNQVRPVYIKGKNGEVGGNFFAKWYSDNPEHAAEEHEIRTMMLDACRGQEGMATAFAHHRGTKDILERIAESFDSGFLTFDHRPLFYYNDDRLVPTFLTKEANEK